MLVLVIAHLAPGHDASNILSEETLRDTRAQVMTPDEARQVGFEGLPAELSTDVRLIVVNARDKRRILNNLEASPAVVRYSAHDVDA